MQPEAKPAATGGNSGGDPTELLYELLSEIDLRRGDIDAELRSLAGTHGDAVYAELVYLLSHLRFEPDEAKSHWQRIVVHRREMERRLDGAIDPRVALVSYFLEVDPRLENPKVIELRLFEQTQAAAFRDELTGLCNYRLFEEHLSREILRHQRDSSPMSLVMIDIDDFKELNDRNGHPAGNEALRTIARLLEEALRKADIAARYGGEEFALVLAATPKAGACQAAERIRTRVQEHAFSSAGLPPLTVSLGVATYPADATTAAGLVRCADRALYAAKARGKNQVFLHGEASRSYRRLVASLDGECCVVSAECRPMTTVNISQRGMLFRVDRPIPIGSLIKVTLMLPEVQREIRTSGRVVRVEETTGGYFETAVRLVELGAKHQYALTRYIQNQYEPASG